MMQTELMAAVIHALMGLIFSREQEILAADLENLSVVLTHCSRKFPYPLNSRMKVSNVIRVQN